MAKAPAARRSTRGRLKGRSWVALGLLLFVTVAGVVVWRRSEGARMVAQMRQLTDRQRALVSERITLEREIRRASSRTRIIAEAQRRLGLHVATDAQSRMLSMSDQSAPVVADTVIADSLSRAP